MINHALYGQMSPVEDAPEEFDQTIFAVQPNRSIGPVERLALNFVKDQQRLFAILIEPFQNK